MSADLRERLEADLRTAIRQQQAARISVLRTTLAALSNAEAVDTTAFAPSVTEVPRRELDDGEIRSIVERERDELRTTAHRMRRVGADARARELLGQARILDDYLEDCLRGTTRR